MGNKEVIRIENVEKTYELGKINGTTLQKSLQSWLAEIGGKEDPNCQIGKKKQKNVKFKALDGIDCRIYEGERVGIIGNNGAGKSTLLKILSRVTEPTQGRICICGKISSMLEVGAGFHGELTGRENIYLNGAILGMNHYEVKEKIDDIITFSECEQFIDTPVKRYSSGMYVKLAFSVAAFLNADIFLMDEVLAVGDMAFQKKCLNKIKQISLDNNKTILYVSHNMQTIRELCDRCIVLEKGKIIHDGDVEKGIQLYMKDILEVKNVYEFSENTESMLTTGNVNIRKIELKSPVLGSQDKYLNIKIWFESKKKLSGLHMRFTVYDSNNVVVGTSVSEKFDIQYQKYESLEFIFNTEMLIEGDYSAEIAFVEPFGIGQTRHAYLKNALAFKVEKKDRIYQMAWIPELWGKIEMPNIKIK